MKYGEIEKETGRSRVALLMGFRYGRMIEGRRRCMGMGQWLDSVCVREYLCKVRTRTLEGKEEGAKWRD